jgi:hypothetical protein
MIEFAEMNSGFQSSLVDDERTKDGRTPPPEKQHTHASNKQQQAAERLHTHSETERLRQLRQQPQYKDILAFPKVLAVLFFNTTPLL